VLSPDERAALVALVERDEASDRALARFIAGSGYAPFAVEAHHRSLATVAAYAEAGDLQCSLALAGLHLGGMRDWSLDPRPGALADLAAAAAVNAAREAWARNALAVEGRFDRVLEYVRGANERDAREVERRRAAHARARLAGERAERDAACALLNRDERRAAHGERDTRDDAAARWLAARGG
jgi:hypothetical protein